MNSEYFRLIRYVVTCVTIIGLVSIVGGIILAIKGYNEANTTILIGGGAVTGLLGLISMRGHSAEEKQPSIPPGKIAEQTTKSETTTKSADEVASEPSKTPPAS